MSGKKIIVGLIAASLVAGAAAVPAKAPDNWDGLVRVSAKRMDLVYLRPGASFAEYRRILLDDPQVAFRKNWKRDYNRSSPSLAGTVSDSDVRRMIDSGREMVDESFRRAFAKAGYELAGEAGADTLRVTVSIIDLNVVAPDVASSPRVRTYAREAGNATIVVEVRDSLSGELLGRAVDERTAGDSFAYRRTWASNRGDFQKLADDWAAISARGLGELKAGNLPRPR